MKKITIKTFLIQENGIIDKEQFVSLQFRNQGETTATVQGNILLQPGETVNMSFYQPDVVIDQSFVVRFDSQAGKKNNVVVIAGVMNV